MTDFMVSREEKNVANKSRMSSIGRGSQNSSRHCQGAFCRDQAKYEASGAGKSIYLLPCDVPYVRKTRSTDRFGVKRGSHIFGSPWGSSNFVPSTATTPDKENQNPLAVPLRSPINNGRHVRHFRGPEKCDVVDPNFLHTFARYVTGNVVDIRTNKNQTIRGVLCGYHQGVNFSIDKPVIIDQSDRISKKLNSPLVLNREDIVEILATNIDKDEVIQNNMSTPDASGNVSSVIRTDAEIASDSTQRSRPNGGDVSDDGIHLKPFYDAGSEPKDTDGFELNGEDGWSVKQMFSKNESLGVPSTYDPTLAEYTTELRKEDTEEYREREARATMLAAEIESSSESRTMADRENDDGEDIDDEEARFSAVQRQQPQASPYQYSRGNGRMQHFSARGGGSQSLRSGGRGQSYRSAVDGSGGMKSSGSNPPHSRSSKEALIGFSRNFRLAKSGPPPPTNTSPSAGSGPRKSDPSSTKGATRGKRVFSQTSAPPPSGRTKPSDDSPEVVSPAEGKVKEEAKPEEAVVDAAPKAIPVSTPPVQEKKPNEVEETPEVLETPVDKPETKEASPSTTEAGDQPEEQMTIKSSLNVDAKPFYPKWSSQVPVTESHVQPVHHPTILPVPPQPYQVQQPPSIAAPLQSQPLQVSDQGQNPHGPPPPPIITQFSTQPRYSLPAHQHYQLLRNGNGAPKQRSAVVSVQSSGPVMNRGNPDVQAAAMTGAPLVAPQPMHHGAPYHAATQRMEWAQGWQPGREAAGAQANANISNPPTPSSTPQQTPTFIPQPAVAQHTYVYQQQTAPHQSIFQQQSLAHQYPHPPHPGQHLPPNNSAMIGPPHALMLYHTVPGHPHQPAGVTNQPQAHHQPQQQHVSNTMPMTVFQTMYPAHPGPQHPAHMQQHHPQQQQHHHPQQQQHTAAALQQAVMQQQFQQASHPHPHPQSLHGLSYAQGPGAPQYMTQSQHAGHAVTQHAPQ